MVMEAKCSECSGLTIQYQGKGLDSQYRVCSQWQVPGHLTEEEIGQALGQFRRAIRPSGRMA